MLSMTRAPSVLLAPGVEVAAGFDGYVEGMGGGVSDGDLMAI
jgi:hypothetical protein